MKNHYKLFFTFAIICNYFHLHAQINFIDNGQTFGTDQINDIAFVDVNGDSCKDAFVVKGAWNTSQKNELWINDCKGNFTLSSQNLGTDGTGIALADLDGDGDLDAFITKGLYITANPSNEIWINDGKGNFANSGQQLGNKKSSGVALADLDGDGDIDAFVCNSTKYINNKNVEGENQVWLNDRKGYFTISTQVFINGEHTSVHLGDLDNDGDMDAFVTSNQGYPDQGIPNENEIWINDGKANFTKKVLSSTCSGDLALGDIDNDGDLGILITYSDATTNIGAKIFLNDGSGNFSANNQNFESTSCWNACLGDLDKDGDLDAILTNGTYQNRLPTTLWMNDGKGNFILSTFNFGNNRDLNVKLVDLNNDGYPDAVVGNKIWLNTTGSAKAIQNSVVATIDLSAFPAETYVIKAAVDH